VSLEPISVVLGAAGFIGRHVARRLASSGATVYGLGHGAWSTEEQRAWGLSRWLEADVDVTALGELVAGRPVAALVHCAGGSAVAQSYRDPLADFQRSANSTAHVLEFARTLPGDKPRVVVSSSAAVYGDQGDVDVTETSPFSPISPYAVHKLAAEQLCDSYARYFGVPVTIVRLFSVYGEGLRKQLLWDACQRFSRGEPQFFGTGHELRDWIHVEDAASLLCAAASSKAQSGLEVFNGAHEKATTRRVLTELGQCLGEARPPVFTGETHTGNPRRLTADCGHARRLLDWSPEIDLAAGLGRYADWFRGLAR
jgi:UDP-glucose 4-epimerase